MTEHQDNAGGVQEPQMPTLTDKLFNESNADASHNAIIRTGISQFFLFSDSYKIAAQKLFSQLDGSAWYANTLVYPIVFTCRHFLELRLKELISGLNYAKNETRQFKDGHGLKYLWDDYVLLVAEVANSYSPTAEEKAAVEKLIKEFDSVDPNSMCFRYPVGKTPDRKKSLQITNLDLENFRLVMEKLFNFFDRQSDIVFHLTDIAEDFFSEMRNAYREEMENYY
jgi:hypothetical protein